MTVTMPFTNNNGNLDRLVVSDVTQGNLQETTAIDDQESDNNKDAGNNALYP